jgi:hypothetical protein
MHRALAPVRADVRTWPFVALAVAALLAVAWCVSTYFFALEAWGARGEPKSSLFEVWALATWCVGPLVVLGIGGAGVGGLVRRR